MALRSAGELCCLMAKRLALIVFALLATGCRYEAKFHHAADYPCAAGKSFITTYPAICKSEAAQHNLGVEMRPDGSCRVCSKLN
jgi:hypothetical protein